MNIEKADYGTIIKFGTIHDFNTKLQMEGKRLDEVGDGTQYILPVSIILMMAKNVFISVS